LAGASGLVAPFHAEDLSIIKRTVDLNNATVLDVLLLPPMLKVIVALALLLAGIVVDVCWRARVGNDSELVTLLIVFFCSSLITFQEPFADGDADDVPGIEEVDMVSLFTHQHFINSCAIFASVRTL
jgi:hypothetical protein